MDPKIKNKHIRSDLIPSDTHEEAYYKQRELWFAKTPGGRLAAGLQMMDDSKVLVQAGIRQRNPGLSDLEVTIEWNGLG